MSGRARAKARGVYRGEGTLEQPGSPRATLGTGNQFFPEQPTSRDRKGYSGSSGPLALESGRDDGSSHTRAGNSPPKCKFGFSAGSAGYKVMDRGGKIRCNFSDMGVNTREKMEHVRDSKTGSSGIPVKVVTNLFGLSMPREWQLYQYHVKFNPELESKRLKAALVYNHPVFKGKPVVFDGVSTLFLAHKQENEVTELFCETQRGETVKIIITLTHQLQSSSPVSIQFLNVTFKKVLKKLSMHQIGQNFYSPSDPVEIPQHKLTLWPGFAVSVGQYENRVMVCADVSHKVLRNESVLEFMTSLYQNVDRARFPEMCEKELVGLIVLTRYNNKTYRIDDIEWSVKATDSFEKRDGTQITYEQYYKQQYDLVLTDLNQPMLVSELKKGRNIDKPRVVHLVPELCYMTGLSSRAKSNFHLMKDLAQEMHLSPETRHQRLSRLADNIQRNKDARLELENWDCSLDARLPLARLTSLQCILIFILFFVCSVQVPDSPLAFVRVLQQNVNPEQQLVLCVLPSDQKDCYDSVKKFVSLEQPIPSQCVLARTLSKQRMMMSVATKMALQIACKLGGELWAVEIPLKSLMVVGIDVNKDAVAKGTSVVGFVASTNASITRWYSHCVIQKAGTMTADCLKVCMEGAINKWQTCNGELPARVIVYRDGIGNGQLRMVVDYEVPQLLSVLNECSGGFRRPKLSVVIVRKQTLCRFFTEANRNLQNPPVGTVIDTEATRPEWYDFFLISQNARQGSVNPTYYNVIYDDNGLKPDHMQRLTYKLCHLYFNWTGLIRVPAPCQYASKLTFLVGQSIHREPSLELADKLYYL
uniref:Piwi like RNA-mediated silencing 4 n=1 Tax=Anolis carolinensis TaxID=28377 RepID=A0A803TEA3_ANOCA